MPNLESEFRIRIEDLPPGRSSRQWSARGESLGLSTDGVRVVSPIDVAIDIEVDMHRCVRLAVRATTVVESPCARCLEPAQDSIQGATQLVFDPSSDAVSDNPVWVADTGELDLGADLREILLIELPVKPLCESDCSGLCENCGANLNRERCTCPAAPVDPRWSALRSLTKTEEEGLQ